MSGERAPFGRATMGISGALALAAALQDAFVARARVLPEPPARRQAFQRALEDARVASTFESA